MVDRACTLVSPVAIELQLENAPLLPDFAGRGLCLYTAGAGTQRRDMSAPCISRAFEWKRGDRRKKIGNRNGNKNGNKNKEKD